MHAETGHLDCRDQNLKKCSVKIIYAVHNNSVTDSMAF